MWKTTLANYSSLTSVDIRTQLGRSQNIHLIIVRIVLNRFLAPPRPARPRSWVALSGVTSPAAGTAPAPGAAAPAATGWAPRGSARGPLPGRPANRKGMQSDVTLGAALKQRGRLCSKSLLGPKRQVAEITSEWTVANKVKRVTECLLDK